MKRRLNQISNIIRAALAQSLTKIKAPEIFTITKVEVAPDLKTAQIWVSSSNPKLKSWEIKRINKYLPIFLEELKKIRLRYLPKLYFHKDESGKATERIEQLIQKIHES